MNFNVIWQIKLRKLCKFFLFVFPIVRILMNKIGIRIRIRIGIRIETAAVPKQKT